LTSWAPTSAAENITTEVSSKAPVSGPVATAPAAPVPVVNIGLGPVETGQSQDSPLLLPLSTQALIPFFTGQFRGGTNDSKVTVVLPVEFHPARPPTVFPSSTATFTQDPKKQ
jgi:hypothetical protein